MKIVINACFGGFSLSHKAIMRYAEIKGIKLYAWVDDISLKYLPNLTVGDIEAIVHYATVTKEQYNKFNQKRKGSTLAQRQKMGDGGYFSDRDIDRTDPALIQVVKELGKDSGGRCAALKVIKIPNNVKWEIDEYDGSEHIAETHRTWS